MNDDYEGQGGSYVIGDAGRELVARTKDPRQSGEQQEPAPAAADEAPAEPAPANRLSAKLAQKAADAAAPSTTQPE
jgi:hypothetical protein